jgi:hypothetical protein
MRKSTGFLGILTIILSASCNKDNPPAAAPAAKGVYITNEGNFGSGNGEISFYDPAKRQVSNNLFYSINGYHLGDVVQSMYIMDSVGFIVVNNSQKVEVVKIPSLQHIRTISIPNSSPRYFLPVSDSTAYVTDLYGSKVHVINFLNGVLVKEIEGFAQWTEHMIMMNGFVVVEERSTSSNPSSTGSIATIQIANNTFGQRYIFTGSNVDGIVKDEMSRIWFGMDGDSAASILPAIFCLNSDLSLNKEIVFSNGHMPNHLCTNNAGNEVYYLDVAGIYRLSITDTVPPAAAFVGQYNHNFYGLGVDPVTEDVYVSDAIDYVQPSRISRYSKTGDSIQSFTAGIISGNFCFWDD